jgi:hypothetical protein
MGIEKKAPAAGDLTGLSPNALEAAKKREEEMNRSVLGQLKPDYAKADGSFKKLRCANSSSHAPSVPRVS